MISATLRERLKALHEAEPTITQAEAARRLRATRARVSRLAQEMRIGFARKQPRRGRCDGCGRVRQIGADRFCSECVDRVTAKGYGSERRKAAP